MFSAVSTRSATARMTTAGYYDLVLAALVQPAIAERLPEAVAVAVIDFLTSALVANPHRVGKRLRDDLEGIWSARRGTYRVLYASTTTRVK